MGDAREGYTLLHSVLRAQGGKDLQGIHMRPALARSLAKAAEGIQQAGEVLQTGTGLLGGRETAAGIPLRHTVAADQVPSL